MLLLDVSRTNPQRTTDGTKQEGRKGHNAVVRPTCPSCHCGVGGVGGGGRRSKRDTKVIVSYCCAIPSLLPPPALVLCREKRNPSPSCHPIHLYLLKKNGRQSDTDSAALSPYLPISRSLSLPLLLPLLKSDFPSTAFNNQSLCTTTSTRNPVFIEPQPRREVGLSRRPALARGRCGSMFPKFRKDLQNKQKNHTTRRANISLFPSFYD